MPTPNENDYEQVKHAYNCDLNYPGELFPPAPTRMVDKTLLSFQQSLTAIIERRDSQMTQAIVNLLKEESPNKRFFFAVGFSKEIILFFDINKLHFFLVHLMGPDGIIKKLRRDHKYSVTRLCTDPLASRFVIYKNMIK
jgi:hypothetical protein